MKAAPALNALKEQFTPIAAEAAAKAAAKAADTAADAAATVVGEVAINAKSAVVVSPSLTQLSSLNVDLTKLNMYVNRNNVDTVRFRIGNEVLPFTMSRESLIETLQKLNTDGNNAALIPEKYREFFNMFSPAQIVKALNYLKTLKAV